MAALAIAAGCALAAGTATALPGVGMAAGPGTVEIARPAAHRDGHWQWQDGWSRRGPWASHEFDGLVAARPVPRLVFLPWGTAEWLRYCTARYRNFDPVTGTYVTRRGKRRVCR
jgi:hypothetical protein